MKRHILLSSLFLFSTVLCTVLCSSHECKSMSSKEEIKVQNPVVRFTPRCLIEYGVDHNNTNICAIPDTFLDNTWDFMKGAWSKLTRCCHKRESKQLHELQEWSRHDNPETMVFHAILLLFPNGTMDKINLSRDREAIKLLCKALAMGHTHAKHLVAFLMHKGYISSTRPENDQVKAVELFKEAAAVGHLPSMSYMTEILYKRIQNPEQGSKSLNEEIYSWCLHAADKGEAYSMYVLSVLLEKGLGCTNIEQSERGRLALSWARKAALLGGGGEIIRLEDLVARGIGCPDSTQKERKQYLINFKNKKVEKENGYSLVKIGYNYQERDKYGGQAIDKIYSLSPEERMNEAVFWYKKAMEKGYKSALYYLGMIYYNGVNGFNKNHDLALSYLRLYERKGGAVHQFLATIYCSKANPSKDDLIKAVKHYNRAKQYDKTISQRLIDLLTKKINGLNEKRKTQASNQGKQNAGLTSKIMKAKIDKGKAAIEMQHKVVMDNLAREMNSEDMDISVFSCQLEKAHEAYTKGTGEQMTLAEQLKAVRTFRKILNNVEEKILLTKQDRQNNQRVREMMVEQRSAMGLPEVAGPNDARLESQAVRLQASEILAAQNRKTIKKEQKVSATCTKSAKLENTPSKVQEVARKGPLSHISIKKKKKVIVPDTAMDNATLILHTIQQAGSLEEAIGLLGELPGGFNFERLHRPIPGFPHAKKAFSMRINQDYRVILPLVSETVYEEGPNNNNDVGKKIRKLYKDRIYVVDHY